MVNIVTSTSNIEKMFLEGWKLITISMRIHPQLCFHSGCPSKSLLALYRKSKNSGYYEKTSSRNM